MIPLLYCSLAALVGAVIVLGTLLNRALDEVREARQDAWRAESAASQAMERQRNAELAVGRIEYALAKEQREHRLLLASRERKRRAKIEELGEFVERLPVTRQNSEPHAHARFEPIAGTPTTEAGAS